MPPLLAIDPAQPTAIHAQIERGLRAAITTGRLPVGSQLPTVRQLAVDLRVNANTVAKVYVELERAGVVETRRGVGTFVATLPATPGGDGRDQVLNKMVRRWIEEAAAAGFLVEDVDRKWKQLVRKP